MPSVGEEARVWATEDDDAESGVLSGRGVSARVLPRVVSAAVGDFTEKDVAYAKEFGASRVGFGARATAPEDRTEKALAIAREAFPRRRRRPLTCST
jgi:hypothetical protein